jgi:predicted amidophosphoribosyltransferase
MPLFDSAACIFDLLWPPLCVLCAAGEAAEFGLCAACRADLQLLPLRGPRCATCGRPSGGAIPSGRCAACERDPPRYARAASAARYCGAARELLVRFKFERDLAAATALLDLLDRSVAMLQAEFDVVVPVPSHPRRERARRFAPVKLLAREFGARASRPVRDRWLRRVRLAKPQGSPEVRSREANVRGAFAATGRRSWFAPVSPSAQRVLLVDDVFTSGATARECAEVLLRAGAKSVFVATVARGGSRFVAPAPAEARRIAEARGP